MRDWGWRQASVSKALQALLRPADLARAPAAPKPKGAPFVLVYHGTLAHRLGLDIAIQAVADAMPGDEGYTLAA